MIDSVTPQCVYPPDRIPGCLYRKSLPGQVCPMAADHIKVIPRAQWGDYAKQIGGGQGLRPFVKTVLDQNGAGSCATESTTGATMISRAFAGLDHVVLNPWFIYHTTSGGRDSGSSIDENLEFVREHGIAPESVWPRSKGWRATPSAEAVEAAKAFKILEFYDVASVNEFVSALLQGYPVVWGANGHAVCAVAHLDDTKPLILNSWGDWEDHGFGVWATYRAIEWGYGAWAVRTTTEGVK